MHLIWGKMAAQVAIQYVQLLLNNDDTMTDLVKCSLAKFGVLIHKSSLNIFRFVGHLGYHIHDPVKGTRVEDRKDKGQ